MMAVTTLQDAPPAEVRAAEEPGWDLSTSVFYSDPPGSDDRVTVVVYADRGPLHLETRYNYEDLDTLSTWVGWKIPFGEEVEVEATPMIGAVMGDTDGFAPGLELDVGWRRIAWYVEAEYLFDDEDSDDNFFYSWSTLTYGITDSLAAGVVFERSKLVDSDFDVQHGLAVELEGEKLGLALYAYNLESSDDFYAVVSVGFAP